MGKHSNVREAPRRGGNNRRQARGVQTRNGNIRQNGKTKMKAWKKVLIALVLILVVSIVLNSVLLLVINNKNNSINKLNDNLESEKNNYKEEIETIVKEIITEVQATNMKDMGKVMKAAKEKIGAAADGKTINEVVKNLLA